MFRPRSRREATIPATSGASMDVSSARAAWAASRASPLPVRRLATNTPGPARDVLELRRPEIGDGEIEPSLHLPIGVLGQTDRARRGDALQSRGDVDAVAHQIAVALLDDVAEMNADAKDDAAVLGHAGVALDHAVLDFDRAAHGVDDAAELDEAAVAGALDDASMMRGDRRIDQIAAQPAKPRQRAILVRAGEPAVADDVRAPESPRVSAFRPWPSVRCTVQNSTEVGQPKSELVVKRFRLRATTLPRTTAMGVRRDKAALSSGCESHPARSLQPEATGAVMEVTKWLKPSV